MQQPDPPLGTRTYRIRSHEEYFLTAGSTPDHRQVLMGLSCPDLLALFFDVKGDLLEVQRRHLEFLRASGVFVNGRPVEGQVCTYDIYDKRIPERLRVWQRELGFVPGVIEVKRFSVPDLCIRIDDYPFHFRDILADPNISAEERDAIHESIREWDADRQFVLLWGNDYWINADGEIVSS